MRSVASISSASPTIAPRCSPRRATSSRLPPGVPARRLDFLLDTFRLGFEILDLRPVSFDVAFALLDQFAQFVQPRGHWRALVVKAVVPLLLGGHLDPQFVQLADRAPPSRVRNSSSCAAAVVLAALEFGQLLAQLAPPRFPGRRIFSTASACRVPDVLLLPGQRLQLLRLLALLPLELLQFSAA